MSRRSPDRDFDVLLVADRLPPRPGPRSRFLRELVKHLPGGRTVVSTPWRRGGREFDRTLACAVWRAPALLPGSHALNLAAWRWHLEWLCRRRRPGLALGCGTEPEAALVSALEHRRAIPFLLQLEAPQLYRIRSEIQRHGETGKRWRRIVRRSAGFLVSTRACWLEAYKLDIRPHNIHVLPPGVDLSRFRPGPTPEELRARLRLGRGPVVLAVPGTSPAVDPETLFRAFAAVRGQVRDAVLVVVGLPGSRWRKLLRSLKIDRSVRFGIGVADEQLPDYYRLADVLLASHREDREAGVLQGLEVPILEALASGLPVVATKTTATEELLVPGEDGLLAEPGAHARLGQMLLELLRSPERRAELSGQAREHAEKCYDAAHAASVLGEFLDVVYYRRLRCGRFDRSRVGETVHPAA